MPLQSKNYNLLYISNKSDNKRQQTITVDYKRLFTDFVLTRGVTLHRQTNQGATQHIKLFTNYKTHTS